jgi:hypothetical protein
MRTINVGRVSAILFGAAIAVAGCSAGNDAASDRAETASADLSTDLRPAQVSPYAFFQATKTSGGYWVSTVNGTSVLCGSGRRGSTCFVSTIDFSILNVPAATSTAMLGLVGRDPYSPQVLFAGSVNASSLVVQEVWKAPRPVPFFGNLILVSNEPTSKALVVDTWRTTSIGTPDFSNAPGAIYCDANAAGVFTCAPSYAMVQNDVTTAAGVILTGEDWGDGTLYVDQYFLKVSIGHDHDTGGYAYCQVGQTACENGFCTAGECTHWGGRGMMPVYDRTTTDPSFNNWLISSGQVATSP